MFALNYRVLNKPSSLLILVIFIVFISYQNTIHDLVRLWVTDGYSHGILLMLVCTYLFFKKWKIKRGNLFFKFNFIGLLLLVFTSFLWLASKATLIKTTEMFSFPIILSALLIYLLGWKQSRVFLFPVLLMLFAMPLFEPFNPILQKLTAEITGILLGITRITSVVEGLLIHVPAGTFEVDVGCSGLRVVNVGAILFPLHAYINNFKIFEAALLIVLGILVSFLSNIVRVYIIVLAGNATQMQHPLVENHETLGWLVFVIVVGLFLFVVHRYWPAKKQTENSTEQPIIYHDMAIKKDVSGRRLVLGLMVSLFAANAGPLFWIYQQNKEKVQTAGVELIPNTIGIWNATTDKNQNWSPMYRAGKGDFSISQTYSSEPRRIVYFNMRYFTQQHLGDEAINGDNRVYNPRDWTRVWVKPYGVSLTTGMTHIEETLLRDKRNIHKEMLVWRWYLTFDKTTGNKFLAKIYNLFGFLTGRPEFVVYIASADIAVSHDDARDDLMNFIQAIDQVAYAER